MRLRAVLLGKKQLKQLHTSRIIKEGDSSGSKNLNIQSCTLLW